MDKQHSHFSVLHACLLVFLLQAQQKYCKDLLDSGVKEIYVHCLGNAINRGLNLALDLVNNSNDTLTYALNTSTIHLIGKIIDCKK